MNIVLTRGDGNWQSELHGMAALQEAVCLDSLNRSNETHHCPLPLSSDVSDFFGKKRRHLKTM
jgi:hypothetical protein